VDAAKDPGTSSVAFGPKTMPLGLMRNRSAFGAVERMVPSMSDADPPVTREMMFRIAGVPLNTAASPVPTSKFEKL
jgi:hypothetical protein